MQRTRNCGCNFEYTKHVTQIQGCEVKVCQFCVKSEVQTLRTVDFKSDSGSLFVTYFQESAMATTGEWRDCLKLTCTSLDCAVR